MVYVGKENLVGEVIGLKKGMTTVQVFEETTGLRPGETVTGTGACYFRILLDLVLSTISLTVFSVLWKPTATSGKYISRGVTVDSLDTEKKWHTHITVKEGDVVGPGTIIAETQETPPFFINPWFRQPSLTEL